MSALPAEFTDRWENRAEPRPGEGLVYWHLLMGSHPEVVALAREAQQRLARFTGLHMTPLKWLHTTVLIAGEAGQILSADLDRMAAAAGRLLAGTAPISVTLGKVLYHPEAIMLAVNPPGALDPVLDAARAATREVTGGGGRSGHQSPWRPHITACYSTSRQPAAPIISSVGRELPGAAIRLRDVSLVIQRGPERLWDWHPAATIRFGG